MITVESGTPQPVKTGASKCKKITCCLFFLLLISGGLGAAVWYLGSSAPLQPDPHPLYSSFDASPPHKKALATITKAKVSILVGRPEDGLMNFVEHYANTLSKKGRTVYMEKYSSTSPEYVEISKDLTYQALSTLGQVNPNCDWVIVSENGELIPGEVIAEFQANYPTSKILIVTSNKQQKVQRLRCRSREQRV